MKEFEHRNHPIFLKLIKIFGALGISRLIACSVAELNMDDEAGDIPRHSGWEWTDGHTFEPTTRESLSEDD